MTAARIIVAAILVFDVVVTIWWIASERKAARKARIEERAAIRAAVLRVIDGGRPPAGKSSDGIYSVAGESAALSPKKRNRS